MFKPSEKKGILEDVELLLEEQKNQNKKLKKINSAQLNKKEIKEINTSLKNKEGELKKKIIIKNKTISKSYRSWLFNNNEL